MEDLRTPNEVAIALGARLRALRLHRNWKRQTLAERAGVSLSTVRRVETTGRGTLTHLLQIAQALGRLGEFEGLFEPPPAQTMAELEAKEGARLRRRGRR